MSNDCVPVEREELQALLEDAARLDYIEAEANREPIVLHATPALKAGYRGLGLANINRTLRQAIDDMRGRTIVKAPDLTRKAVK